MNKTLTTAPFKPRSKREQEIRGLLTCSSYKTRPRLAQDETRRNYQKKSQSKKGQQPPSTCPLADAQTTKPAGRAPTNTWQQLLLPLELGLGLELRRPLLGTPFEPLVWVELREVVPAAVEWIVAKTLQPPSELPPVTTNRKFQFDCPPHAPVSAQRDLWDAPHIRRKKPNGERQPAGIMTQNFCKQFATKQAALDYCMFSPFPAACYPTTRVQNNNGANRSI